MSLLILPVDSDAVTDRDLHRAISAILLAAQASPGLPHIRILPTAGGDWAAADKLLAAHPCFVGATVDLNTPRTLEDRIAEAVRELRQSAAVADATAGDSECLVIMPVVRLSKPRQTLAHLDNLWRAMDEVGRQLRSRAAKNAMLNAADFSIVPWVFSEVGIDYDQLAPAFCGSAEFGATAVRPVLCTQVAQSGRERTWSGYGVVQLQAAATLLLCGSAARTKLAEVIRAPRHDGGIGGRSWYDLNAALFEYPYLDSLRKQLLAHLVGGDGDRVLPDMAALDDLKSATKTTFGDASAAVAAIATLVKRDEVDADKLGSDLKGVSYAIAPSAADLDETSLHRRADGLHTAVLAGLKALVGRRMEAALAQAVTAVHDEVRARRRELGHALSARLATADAGELGPTATAVGLVFGCVDEVELGLKALAEASDANSDATEEAQVLQDALAMREGWIQGEEELFVAAATLPTVPALCLTAVAAALGVAAALAALMAYSSVLRDASPVAEGGAILVIGAGVAALQFWRAKRQLVAYHDEWQTFSECLKSQTQSLVKRLAAIINRKLRRIKADVPESLCVALAAVRSRLKTELAGLTAIVSDELEMRRSLEAELEAQAATAEAAGRFRLRIGSRVALQFEPGPFHQRLATLLTRTVTVDTAPEPVFVRDWRRLIDDSVHDSVRGHEQTMSKLDDEAAATLARAQRFAAATANMASHNAEGRIYAMVGSEIGARAAVVAALGQEPQTLGWQAPAELAIVFRIQQVREGDRG